MRRIYELHPPEEDAEWEKDPVEQDPGILLPSCGRIMNYYHLKKTQNGKRILWIKALVFYCLHAADIWTKPTQKDAEWIEDPLDQDHGILLPSCGWYMN